jgi:hypothetical protein
LIIVFYCVEWRESANFIQPSVLFSMNQKDLEFVWMTGQSNAGRGMAQGAVMRNLGTSLCGLFLLAWVAYLSWPATADVPAEARPVLRDAKPTARESADAVPIIDTYFHSEKSNAQPSV